MATVLGGFGIGAHSYASLSGSAGAADEAHDDVDPNAAWFALICIAVKEVLYRASA